MGQTSSAPWYPSTANERREKRFLGCVVGRESRATWYCSNRGSQTPPSPCPLSIDHDYFEFYAASTQPPRIRAIKNFQLYVGHPTDASTGLFYRDARFLLRFLFAGVVMWRNEFTPEDLKEICDCFDMAWNFVEQSAAETFPEPALCREILALQVFGFAKKGETDKIRIANLALGHLRQVAQRDRSQQRVRARIASAA